MRVLKISCCLLFVAAFAQNAGAQSSEQSAKAALSSAKKPKGIESSVAAQLPTRVLINFPSAANTTSSTANVGASNKRKASQPGALMSLQVAASASPPAQPSVVVRKPAKNNPTAEH